MRWRASRTRWGPNASTRWATPAAGFVSLAFAGAHPERLRSLALFEPASVPGPLSHDEAVLAKRLGEQLQGLDGEAFPRAFITLQLAKSEAAP